MVQPVGPGVGPKVAAQPAAGPPDTSTWATATTTTTQDAASISNAEASTATQDAGPISGGAQAGAAIASTPPPLRPVNR